MQKRIFWIPRLFLPLVIALSANSVWGIPEKKTASTASLPAAVQWSSWSDAAFSRAAKEKKLLILDLEANWCHWCHVMEERTYSDPKIIRFIQEHFIALRDDQAARPDLAARYDDYGWPATIILDAEGNDLWRGSGFVAPEEFLETLQKIVQNPADAAKALAVNSHHEEADAPSALSLQLKSELRSRHYAALDKTLGGLEGPHRFLNADAIEFSLSEASRGKDLDASWVRTTLSNNLKLLDPVWGGSFQYSTDQDWDHPHFEKIMRTQANTMQIYALGFLALHDARYLEAAKGVRNYVNTFLKDSKGAYYASQDADLVKGEHSAEYFALSDKDRRAKGMPAIDIHIYTRENGWISRALAVLYSVTEDSAVLEDALRAVRWVEENRGLPEGGFRHGEVDVAGPLLDDQVAMLYAYVSLYQVSADRSWLSKALQTAKFISDHFLEKESASPAAGAFSVALPKNREAGKSVRAAGRVRLIDQNVELARAANLLFQYSGDEQVKSLAMQALRYLAQERVALEYRTATGILLADAEIANEPMHLTVLAPKNSVKGKELFGAALKQFGIYKRLEWWDRSEGELPRGDVQYPELPDPAAFVCANKRCSLPIFSPEGISETLARFQRPS